MATKRGKVVRLEGIALPEGRRLSTSKSGTMILSGKSVERPLQIRNKLLPIEEYLRVFFTSMRVSERFTDGVGHSCSEAMY